MSDLFTDVFGDTRGEPAVPGDPLAGDTDARRIRGRFQALHADGHVDVVVTLHGGASNTMRLTSVRPDRAIVRLARIRGDVTVRYDQVSSVEAA